MNYEDAVSYVAEIPKFTKKHPFEHTRKFLERLGNPCKDRKILHVAGTNGKGSVCAFMQAILRAEGKTVGFFTSPHLIKVNERICINGTDISDEEFAKVITKVYEVVKQMEADGLEHPSYFEFLYAAGMLAFEEAGVEYIILETGLGGRLDATNSFDTPRICVITSIGLDHMYILGNTITEIAGEKAGIIKEGIPVIYDANEPDAAAVIESTAGKNHAKASGFTEADYRVAGIKDGMLEVEILREGLDGQPWRVRGTGLYQAMNLTLALSAMKELLKEVNGDLWRAAIEHVLWPGRMEEVAPGVILDGAHNLPAIRQFVKTVSLQMEQYGLKQPVILFSAVEDKDYVSMIELLCKGIKAKCFVITKIEDKRGAASIELANLFRTYTDQPVYVEDSLEEAYAKAISEKGEEGRLYCLGSLYLVGELKELIGGNHA